MLRTRTLVLCMLALFLCSAAAMADEGQESENGKTTLKSLATGVAVAAYNSGHFVLKEGACDGSRAGLNGLRNGADWAVHKTPAEYGHYVGRGGSWTFGQALQTPDRAWRATKWGLGHLW